MHPTVFDQSTVFLNVQYRMHPVISAFPSSYFYEGKLLDGITGAARPSPQGFPWPSQSSPLAFVHVVGNEEGEVDPLSDTPFGTFVVCFLFLFLFLFVFVFLKKAPFSKNAAQSRCNMEEVEVVLEILRGFRKSKKVSFKDIGVITPYFHQSEKMKAAIEKEFPGGSSLLVSTVDGFQGMEKEVIIFSAVRSNRSVLFFSLFQFCLSPSPDISLLSPHTGTGRLVFSVNLSA